MISGLNTKVILTSRPVGLLNPSNFKVVKEAITKPSKKGDVLIQSIYLSLDPAMRGWVEDAPSYLPPVKLGDVMRGLCVGIVIESMSHKYKQGDTVIGMFGWQSYVVINDKVPKAILSLAPNIPGIPAVAWLGPFGNTGLTAYFGLLRIGMPKAGETVLISGAAGAVGSIAGQIAKIKGCRVVGTAGTDEKCRKLIEKFGFDAAINYKTAKNLSDEIRKACPNGVDVFFDNVGGWILDTALRRINARIVLCGAISQYGQFGNVMGPKNYLNLITKKASMTGFIVLQYANEYDIGVQELTTWFSEGKLNYELHILNGGLEEAPNALSLLFDGQNKGKLVVKVSQEPPFYTVNAQAKL